jgi:4-cresol dehydrogenase (hydroxylating)
MPLPPGVSDRDFAAALEEFANAVGAEWVFSSDEDVDLYRDAYSPFLNEPEDPVPSAAVAPRTVEQVQACVRIANRYTLPLWILSTGKNLGYGGSAPKLSGSVMIDLKRMDRILEISETNHYALVEPGVSYFDLYREIRRRGLKVWIDPPDPGWGSVIGNALERGGGYTPMRDHFAAHCGMEVVLPDGELIRTGMGALPGARTWQQYSYGFGPFVDGIFSQSSLGIVTKMGIWLLPEPEAYRRSTVSVPDPADLPALVEEINYLMNSQTVQGTLRLQSALASFGDAASNRGWSADLQFYGPDRVVDAQWEYSRERIARRLPQATFAEGPKYRFPLSDEEIAGMANAVPLGIPGLQAFQFGAGVNHGHLWFAPIIPMTGESILEAVGLLSGALAELGVPPSALIPPQSYFPRSIVIFVGFPITTDIETNRRTRETYRRLIELSAERGWGEYRTHIAFMDDVMQSYSFNEHALLRLHERMKDTLDPNGILAPGKNGIWPARLRGDRA